MRLCLIPISQAAGSIADYCDLYFAGIEHSIHEINMITYIVGLLLLITCKYMHVFKTDELA